MPLTVSRCLQLLLVAWPAHDLLSDALTVFEKRSCRLRSHVGEQLASRVSIVQQLTARRPLVTIGHTGNAMYSTTMVTRDQVVAMLTIGKSDRSSEPYCWPEVSLSDMFVLCARW